jgi:hypothetical protein
VIHGTILAFAQRPTWPTLGGCLQLGGIARHGARARSGGALRVSFAKLPDLIRGPQAEASRLTLLEINALATSLKDCLV